MQKKYFSITVFLLLSFCTKPTYSWVYPEHREIMLIAIEKLDHRYKVKLDNLWTDARRNYSNRLSENVIEPSQSVLPNFMDYAAWPAVAGDHSCSPKEMLDVILNSDWILKVADVAARLGKNLIAANSRNDRINALRDSDIKFEEVDPKYATRAGNNNVHFLLPVKETNVKFDEYFNDCINEGAEINALGVYIWFHNKALQKAKRISKNDLSEDERSTLTLAMLADEAFALHFLEDVFAAGHVAGTWGDASQRKGTHDYYNEKGLRTVTWDNEQIILTGDAWMRPEDSARSAETIKISLQQIIDATEGKLDDQIINDDKFSREPDSLNVCETNFMPYTKYDDSVEKLFDEVIKKTPVPGLIEGLGELPRFRAELGMFIGFSPSLHGAVISNGFSPNQSTIGLTGGIDAALRFGVGLDGVLNESGDGLAYLEIGWRQNGASTNGIVEHSEVKNYGNILAAIPGRSSLSARIRIPFYLIPGDLLLAGPFLFLLDKDALTNMGVKAVNGGLIPWQTGITTSLGRFQFVLGREIGVYLYGRTKGRDALYALLRDTDGKDQIAILSYRSTQVEFPFLEYRPFRSFATDQSSSLLIQFYAAVDFPNNITILSTLAEKSLEVKLNKVWYFGARLIFDWRHYF